MALSTRDRHMDPVAPRRTHALARVLRVMLFSALCAAGLGLALSPAAQTAGSGSSPEPGSGSGSGVLLDLHGAIGPASVDHVSRALGEAVERQAPVVVLRLDTPGGLDASMREIIQEILRSPVPVLTWVGPSGARAASAGTYILYASHVAAMAPGTHVGAATPVAIGGGFGSPLAPKQPEAPEAPEKAPSPDSAGSDKGAAGGGKPADKVQAGQALRDPVSAMEAKAVNDAVAFIRSLAELRGRNAEWAEQAVRAAASLGANDALKQGVTDLLASSIEELLDKAHGRVVTVGDRPVTLATRGLSLETIEPDWRNRLLAVLTNPNIALILMAIGFYGLLFEFMNPGALYPGTIGAIALLLGLYSLSALPVNYAGMALMILGVALLVAEAMSPSFGILGIGGTIALILGGTILIDTDLPALQLSRPLLAGLAVVGVVFAVLVGRLALSARTRRPETGAQGMVGAGGLTLDWAGRVGHVRVAGERWQASSEVDLAPGVAVRVVAVDGLTVRVEPGAGLHT